MSDLHTELWPFTPPELVDSADVVVLAGDVARSASAIHWARANFADVPVVFVPGNHEYYGGNLSRTAIHMNWAAEGTNVHLLDNDAAIIDDVRFLGTTLWTDFELFGGPENRSYALAMAKQCMADFNCITYGSTGWFRPEQSVELHRIAVQWLETRLAEPFPGKTVVVTHHAPHRKSVAPRFVANILSAAFASDLERLMGRATLWLHGHTHDAFDYEVRGTRVVCNPRGYRSERTEFDPRLIVEV